MKDRIYAIIVAGGTGSRMKSSVPKQYLDLRGKPILQYSIEKFLENELIDACIIVAHKMYHKDIEDMTRGIAGKNIYIVENGTERIDSVKNGLDKALSLEESYDNSENGGMAYVMIHDGARPLISEKLISDSIENVKKYRAIVPAIALKDTIKKINDSNEVLDTPERAYLRAAQTPQCFELNLILDAFDKYNSDTLLEHLPTDDGSLIELYSDANVVITEGDENNLKITTPIDLRIAEMILGDESQ